MLARNTEGTGFIGGGNMAEALLRGLVRGDVEPTSIVVAEPVAERRASLAERFGVTTTADNLRVVSECPTVILAVKPQILDDVLRQLAGHLGSGHLVISIAAGARIARIEGLLANGVRVIRVMPNTPCLVGRGASVLCCGSAARPKDAESARRLFAAVGEAFLTDDERLLDAVTGLSGSGPAYVYLFAEALIRGGIDCGLPEPLARSLTYQTLAGAAEMLRATGQSPEELRKAVSSPGGTTVAGLARLDSGRFAESVAAAVETATRRSRELGGG